MNNYNIETKTIYKYKRDPKTGSYFVSAHPEHTSFIKTLSFSELSTVSTSQNTEEKNHDTNNNKNNPLFNEEEIILQLAIRLSLENDTIKYDTEGFDNEDEKPVELDIELYTENTDKTKENDTVEVLGEDV
jgi:hypothetical protein